MPSFKTLFVRFVVTLGAVAAAASGQPPEAGALPATPALAPPLDELLASARERAPAIAALRSQLSASREMEGPATVLPDPMVEAMVQDASFPRNTIGKEAMSMAGFEVRQSLILPGKRRAAGSVARAATAERVAELAELEAQVGATVRTLYAQIYALDREAETFEASRELLRVLSSTASARYATGETEQEAVIKALLQISRLEERLDDLTTERAVLVTALNRWLDLPGEAPFGKVVTLPPFAFPGTLGGRSAETATPAVVLATRAVASAEQRLAAARLETRPNLSAAAAFGWRDTLDPVVTLRFGAELPLWKGRKQQPLIRAAEAELEAMRQRLRDRQAEARAEAARIAIEGSRAERQVARYRDAIVPQTSVALDAARSSYLAGRGDFSTVIEDFGLWLEARVQLARREADRFVAWADLQRLTGAPSPAAGGRP